MDLRWHCGEFCDPCYHSSCDDSFNIDRGLLGLNADAAAYATIKYALSTERVNGNGKRDKRFDRAAPGPSFDGNGTWHTR